MVGQFLRSPFIRLYWSNQANLRQCQPTGEAVKPTFRGVLTDSHIAAVAIVVLLVWSIDSFGKALYGLLVLAFVFSDSVVTIGLMWWHDGILTIGSREMFFDRSL